MLPRSFENMISRIRKEIKRARRNVFSINHVVLQSRKINDIQRAIKKVPKSHPSGQRLVSLDLGCGDQPKNPFLAQEIYGVDLKSASPHIKTCDLVVEPVPFDDQSFDYVTAFDLIEHIPRVIYAPDRRFPFIELMNEIYRVLRPGGVFLSHTPAYPFSNAFKDPTHVNIITEETFPEYFCYPYPYAKNYGYTGSFTMITQNWKKGHLVSILMKK